MVSWEVDKPLVRVRRGTDIQIVFNKYGSNEEGCMVGRELIRGDLNFGNE